MEWVPVIERVGFPIAMVLILVAFITAVGVFFGNFLWKQFFEPVKTSMLASLNENSETNQAILKIVENHKSISTDSHSKIVAMAERQSGFHDFLQKAGGYGMLLSGASAAKDNGEKLDRIEKKVDVVVERLK